MKTITIKNCRSCPFCEHNFDAPISKYITSKPFANCLFPAQLHEGKYKVDSYFKNYSSPKFCPLKKDSLKIQFKK